MGPVCDLEALNVGYSLHLEERLVLRRSHCVSCARPTAFSSTPRQVIALHLSCGSLIAVTMHPLDERHDPETDVLYLLSLEGEIARSIEVSPGISDEFDGEGKIIGVEILRAPKILAERVVASLHAKQAGVI